MDNLLKYREGIGEICWEIWEKKGVFLCLTNSTEMDYNIFSTELY